MRKGEKSTMRVNQYTLKNDSEYQLKLVKERSFNYPKESGCKFDSPEKVARFLNDILDMSNLAEEYVYLISLDVKLQFKGFFELSHGTCNFSYISTKSIFIRALLCGSTNLIIVHNHPSKNLEPSTEDIKAYNKLKKAAELLEINIVDFIIIGGCEYLSFNQEGL